MADENKKLQSSISNVGLREMINAQADKYHGSLKVLGLSGLTWNSSISSSRSIMANTHAQHTRNLLYPELPKVETGMEKMAGDLSTSYKKAKNPLTIHAIVPRFTMPGKEKHLYIMFLYDEKEDKYTMIEKKNIEDLTEKFSYVYNTENMDSREVGDVYKEGEVITASNSYDEFNNYRRGVNVKTLFLIDNDTIEDATKMSYSLSKKLATVESEVVRISLNTNEFFKNRYGNGDEYKGFPDIGKAIKDGVLAATLRKHNDQVLYTMSSKNLKEINYSSDTPYYCDGFIEDIMIYSNKTLEEIPDDKFNHQIRGYIQQQNEFYEKMLAVTKDILDSGSNFSSDITFWYQKAKDALDPMILYKTEENRKFDNMIIEFLVTRVVDCSVGDKIAGRAGNKGVVSTIVPDDEMPILETGERVDLVLNSLGVINRLNSQQIFEISINFITNRTIERLKEMKSYEEMDELLIKVVSYFNEDQSKNLAKFIKKLKSEDAKKDFYERLYKTGIIIRIPPMWDEIPMLDRLTKFYDENDWVKPYKVFIKRFNRWVRIMNDLPVGDMYILKLKQTSSKGLIVRSTGSISKRGIPVKSKSPHKEPFSKTPIRIGDGENSNFGIGIPTPLIAKMHLFYRNSPAARQYIGEKLATTVEGLNDVEINELMTNRNAEILNAYFKFKGVKLEFHDRYDYLTVFDDRTKRTIDLGDQDFFTGTDREILKESIRRELKSTRKNTETFRIRTVSERDKEISSLVEEEFTRRYGKGKKNKKK